MKKQLFITALSGLLFTGALNMYGEVTETPATTSTETTTVDKAEKAEKTEDSATAPGSKYSMPTFADAKTWCSNHYLLLGGAAGVVGFFVLLKTSKSFRAFLGFEDEEEQDTKLVY